MNSEIADMSREDLITELVRNYTYKLRHLSDDRLRGMAGTIRVERIPAGKRD